MSDLIQKADALRALEEAVAEYGEDYVVGADSCLYTDDEGKHCLVGLALKKLGLPIPHVGHPKNVDVFSDIWQDWYPHTFTIDARRVLSSAQELQDGSHPWGVVLEVVKTGDYSLLEPLEIDVASDFEDGT